MDFLEHPWAGLAPASISFCEARLSGWIAEPSNAISNLAFVVPAVWVLRQRRQTSAIRAVEGFAAILLALTSFLFHASGSRLFEVADLSSMYLLPSLSVAVLLADRGQRVLAFLAPFLIWGSATLLMAVTGSDGIVAWGALFALSVAIESRRAQVLPPEDRYRDVKWVVGSFFASYAVWWTDKLGWLCHPDNHVLTGHAVWHFGTAAAIYFFYRQHLRVTIAQGNSGKAPGDSERLPRVSGSSAA